MLTILRSIAAIVAGFIVTSMIMMIVEFINGRFLYPGMAHAAASAADREALRSVVAAAPLGAMLVVIAGWILGSVAGGWVAGVIAARAKVAHGLVLGALLTLAGVANNLMIPMPLWFWIVSLAVLLPSAYLGARLAARIQ